VNFEDEPYVRVYTRDTVTWKKLGWEGQTVLLHMVRDKFDRAGVLDLDGHDPSQAVTAITGLPIKVTTAGVARLLDSKTWVLNQGKIIWPNFVEAQTCRRSDRLRQQESREGRRQKALKTEVVSPAVTTCHQPSQTVTLSSSSPLAAPSSAAAEISDARQRPMRNLAEALKLDVRTRAKRLSENPTDADWAQPQSWPEVLAVSAAICASLRLSACKFGPLSRDSGLRTLVDLFAAGFSQADLERAAAKAVKDPWFSDPKHRGLSAFSTEVVRRLLDSEPTESSEPTEDPEAVRLRGEEVLRRAQEATARRFGGSAPKAVPADAQALLAQAGLRGPE
jgi:hypothetical protein